MQIAANQGVGQSDAFPFHNEPSKERVVLAWGTVTDVDLEVSPDGGSTWVVIQALDGGGSFIVPIPSNDGYQLRVNVTTGSGVYVNID